MFHQLCIHHWILFYVYQHVPNNFDFILISFVNSLGTRTTYFLSLSNSVYNFLSVLCFVKNIVFFDKLMMRLARFSLSLSSKKTKTTSKRIAWQIFSFFFLGKYISEIYIINYAFQYVAQVRIRAAFCNQKKKLLSCIHLIICGMQIRIKYLKME